MIFPESPCEDDSPVRPHERPKEENMRFRFNERKTAQAAAYLLKLAGGKYSHMSLIKLLYLADRAALAKHGKPLTGAWMVSMEHGPVLSEVLNLINEGPPREALWPQYISPSVNYEVSLKVAEPETDELSNYERRLLSQVYERFGKQDRWALVRWLHDNLPEWKDPDGSVLSIDHDEIFKACNVPAEKIERFRKNAEMLWELGSLGR